MWANLGSKPFSSTHHHGAESQQCPEGGSHPKCMVRGLAEAPCPWGAPLARWQPRFCVKTQPRGLLQGWEFGPKEGGMGLGGVLGVGGWWCGQVWAIGCGVVALQRWDVGPKCQLGAPLWWFEWPSWAWGQRTNFVGTLWGNHIAWRHAWPSVPMWCGACVKVEVHCSHFSPPHQAWIWSQVVKGPKEPTLQPKCQGGLPKGSSHPRNQVKMARCHQVPIHTLDPPFGPNKLEVWLQSCYWLSCKCLGVVGAW